MRFITLDPNNKIIGIRSGSTIVEGEIQNDKGTLGDILQADGTFIKDPTPPPPPTSTIDDKINYLYYKAMEVI